MKIHEIHNVQENVLREPIAGRFAMAFLLMGSATMLLYFFVALGVASQVNEYFGYAKEVRDSAVSGSSILGNLSSIKATSAWLEPLKIMGLSFLIFGIAISFALSILKTLRLRLQIMSEFVEMHVERK